MNKIIVIGSLSMDFVVSVEKKPKQGETVFGEDFQTAFGGKGANQAVAASRLGENVEMVGAVGGDEFGKQIIQNLQKQKITIDKVERVTHLPSGSAHITLSEEDNSIIVIPSANNQVFLQKEQLEKLLDKGSFVILQHEIPQETNEKIIEYCYQHEIPVLLNPAPARTVSPEILEKITYLTPNEHEFKLLFPDEDLSTCLKKHANHLIVTLGSKGAIFNDGQKEQQIPGFSTKIVDTTGAGDTFNGALAVAIVQGLPLAEAVKFANLAASISVTGFGAQGGMPTMETMKEHPSYEEKWGFEK